MYNRTAQVETAPSEAPKLPAAGPNGLQELGQGISQAGGAIANMAVRAYKEQVDAEANGAISDFDKRLNERMWDNDTGLMHKPGEMAFDADKELPKLVTQDIQEISAKLRTPAARIAFQERIKPSITAAQRQVENHVYEQGQIVKEANFDARKAAAHESAALNPDQTDIYIASLGPVIAEHDAPLGEEAQKASVGKFISSMRQTQVHALLSQERFVDAKNLFNPQEDGSISQVEKDLGAAAPEMHNAVMKAWLPQRGLELARKIGSTTIDARTGIVNTAMQKVALDQIQDAELWKSTFTQLSLENTLSTQQYQQGIGDLFTGLYNTWKTSFNTAKLDKAAMADLRTRGEDGAQRHEKLWNIIHADIKHAQENQDRKESRGRTPEQRIAMLKLLQFDEDNPEALRSQALTPEIWVTDKTSGLSKGDQSLADKLFLDRQSQNYDLSVPKRTKDRLVVRMKEILEEKKFEPSKWSVENQDAYIQVLSDVTAEAGRIRRGGHEPSDADLTKVVDTALGHGNGKKLLGGLITTAGPRRYEAELAGQIDDFKSDELAADLSNQDKRAAALADLRQGDPSVSENDPLVDAYITAQSNNPKYKAGIVGAAPLPPKTPPAPAPAPEAVPGQAPEASVVAPYPTDPIARLDRAIEDLDPHDPSYFVNKTMLQEARRLSSEYEVAEHQRVTKAEQKIREAFANSNSIRNREQAFAFLRTRGITGDSAQKLVDERFAP